MSTRIEMSMSLALKLDRARQDLEYWQKIAEDPKLSSAAAQAAHATKCGPIRQRCGVTKGHSPIRSRTAKSALDEHSANK